jgi:hypothetical protein
VFVRLSVQEILAALRNRRELQRLKPTSKNSAKAGLKPGPTMRADILRTARRIET